MVRHISTFLCLLDYVRFGRDQFQEALKVSGRVESSLIDWTKFKYMVFDAPKHGGTYSDRYVSLGTFIILIH